MPGPQKQKILHKTKPPPYLLSVCGAMTWCAVPGERPLVAQVDLR